MQFLVERYNQKDIKTELMNEYILLDTVKRMNLPNLSKWMWEI